MIEIDKAYLEKYKRSFTAYRNDHNIWEFTDYAAEAYCFQHALAMHYMNEEMETARENLRLRREVECLQRELGEAEAKLYELEVEV